MDRGAWRATVHGIAESWTRLSAPTTTQCVHVNPKPLIYPSPTTSFPFGKHKFFFFEVCLSYHEL